MPAKRPAKESKRPAKHRGISFSGDIPTGNHAASSSVHLTAPTSENVHSENLEQSALESVKQELAANQGKLEPEANFLALSGGGGDGAFGAGILCGWTAAGTRPRFKLVTGISTGALIAPFAFLGPEYDAKLEGSLHHDIR